MSSIWTSAEVDGDGSPHGSVRKWPSCSTATKQEEEATDASSCVFSDSRTSSSSSPSSLDEEEESEESSEEAPSIESTGGAASLRRFLVKRAAEMGKGASRITPWVARGCLFRAYLSESGMSMAPGHEDMTARAASMSACEYDSVFSCSIGEDAVCGSDEVLR